MTDQDVEKWIKARNAAFEAGDLTWAEEMLPRSSSPEAVAAAFHKARHQCLTVSEEKRIESRDWLAERGLTDLMGQPVGPDDPLPT